MCELIGVGRDRWDVLMMDSSRALAESGLALGWHWCLEWDGLLVGPNMDELRCCTCKIGTVMEAKRRMLAELPSIDDDDDDAPSVLNWDGDLF